MGSSVSMPSVLVVLVVSSSSSASSAGLVAVPLVLMFVGISLLIYLVREKRRKWRNAAANDVESLRQPQEDYPNCVMQKIHDPKVIANNNPSGVIQLDSTPEQAHSHLNIMPSPTPLLQQTLISSPAPYHNLHDSTRTSMSSKNTFTYEELNTATNGFSMDNLLGRGGFGPVFKGVINGREVAVKKLESGSRQGDREFQAEVETISRVHHRHLVSLVGFCITADQRLLVYEFVPNQTLQHHLHDKKLPTMEWSKRLKIALGSAKGLTYLHEDCYPKTIHRDIKSANILLHFNFEPKVADFGLAKQSSEDITHVSTRIMGTFGYLDPEYASSGKLTDKSDVFSFGVVLLELITGRRPVDTTQRYMDGSLVEWAKPLLNRSIEENNYYDEIVDPRLQHLGYNKDEMRRMVACAAACVRHSARQRPRISLICEDVLQNPINIVVKVLEGDVSIDELHDGVKPGQSTIYSPHYGETQYNNDMEKHMNLALSSEEFPKY